MRPRGLIVGAWALTALTFFALILFVFLKVPVAQPCVVGTRPAAPLPLNKQYTPEQWKALDPKQKAAIVSAHALALKTYGENVNGATAGCTGP